MRALGETFRGVVLILLLAVGANAIGQEPAKPKPQVPAVEAPRVSRAIDRAREVVPGLSGDAGYRRESMWHREMTAAEIADVPLQLYAGNEYAFVLGIDGDSEGAQLSLFDGKGTLVPSALLRRDGALVLTTVIHRAGVYHLRPASGRGKVALALTYVYK